MRSKSMLARDNRPYLHMLCITNELHFALLITIGESLFDTKWTRHL